jgi:hypothetical protein
VAGTAEVVKKFVKATEVHHPLPAGDVKGGKKESTEGLAD